MLKKSNVLHGPLTSEELSEAERFWIQFEQEKFFSEELKSLKDNKIEKESPLYNYMPYLDENTHKIRRKARILKYLTKPTDQLTSPLPSDRTNQTPAFSVCGMDFCGPLYVNNFGKLQKSYIVLFTCGVTRALHLELVSDMTTNSFLLAFRRFLARRGNCKVIYRDNAKTFLKSKKEIENLSRILSQSMVQNFFTKERIIWKIIIERSPWWGGFYERLVRSVKENLHKILGKTLLSFEEMTTIPEIEAVLNLRPLRYVYEENDEPRPLTPMHFLNFEQNQPTYPVTFVEILENASTKSSLLKRKKYQQLLLK
ncbi:integrase catalytic domain-containing protein [Trichonephila clavipes]|uniref:Integrase catalytic domain-containing protein n=1 Tax=Trichonephila clavipes TaxID=2585209 RepID=A0A8X6W9B5_TRICX|nr:integrase catalytic domain-containing protein [Trichonephila clavipes]